MIDNQTEWQVRVGWAAALGTAIALSPSPVWAQVTPDNTLGTEASTVGDGIVNGDPVQLIEGGAARGGNLFHSFSEFNVGLGEAVYFANPADIENILSRVTGVNLSNIDGLLGVNGSANLFLLNPNGVLFGPDAQLDIAGSLTVSTGNSFLFNEGEFSATVPTVPDSSLLTISVPLGLQLDTPPQGNLVNQADLAVGLGQTLTLHGDGVASTVRLAAPGGAAQVLGSQVFITDSETSSVLGPSGDTDLFFRAMDGIGVTDLADDVLLFANGTGQIVLEADANADGVGDVVMFDVQDTLQTNGRNLSVSGVNFVLGMIDTSVQSEIIAGDIINVDAGGLIPNASSFDSPGIANFTFTVPEGVGSIDDLNVRFSAEHPQTSNLDVVLIAPNGTSLGLLTNVPFGENFQDMVLDDEASIPIAGGSTPFDGSFQPEGDGGLAIFDGQLSEGTWTLQVIDNNTFGDSGTLFQAGDTAPWGIAQGTQLMINTLVIGGEGNGGAVALDALGDVSVDELITVGMGANGQGGAVEISAGGDIVATAIDASSLENQGGDVALRAEGNIQMDTPDTGATFPDVPDLIDASGGENSGDGGQIQIEAEENITLIGNIDASASSLSNSGDGGAITIVSNSGNVEIEGRLNSRSRLFPGPGDSGDGGDISVSSNSGDVSIDGRMDTFSSFSGQIESDSGDGGAINVFSDSGAITVDAILYTSFGDTGDGGNITISSDSGDVTVGRFLYSASTGEGGRGGAITISSNTGDVLVDGNLQSFTFLGDGGQSGAITVSSVSGNVTVDAFLQSLSSSPQGNGGAITVSSVSGDVTVDGELASRAFSSEGSGDGGAIVVSSASGDVMIEGNLNSSSSSVATSPNSFPSGNSGDGGAIIISSASGDIAIGGFLDSASFSLSELSSSGNSGNAGTISVLAPNGNIQTNTPPEDILALNLPRISAFSVAPDGTAGTGGKVTLEAESIISGIESGLEIRTLSSSGESGGVEIQTNGSSSTVSNLSLITSGQVEIPDPTKPDETITLNLDEFGQAGNTVIESSGDIVLENTEIQADANGSQPAGGVAIASSGQVTFINSQISSNANNEGDAGTIRIDAERLEIGNGGRIFAATSGDGNGGSVIINATDSVFLGEGVQDSAPIISVEASGAGRPGTISINTPTFVLSETAQITATATATATNTNTGEGITLSANQMDLAGRVGIFAETQGEAPGGVLTLQPYQSNPDLNVTLEQGALVSASTSGSGNGGSLAISAPEAVTLSGPGRLAVETSGAGTGGNIEVETERLTLADGVTLSASTTTGSTGDGGNITLTADETTLLNGGQIEVNSAGAGQGGDVILDGDSLILTEGSRITAETASTDGGNLDFALTDTLLLRDGSTISTNAGTEAAGGDGGNITLTMPDGFVVAVPEENSDITANAFTGDGGNVDITVNSLLGIAFRPQQTPRSDITASSEFGLSGPVSIVELNPVIPQNDLELPIDTAPPTLAQGCQTPADEVGSFVVSSRGGLPTNPTDVLGTDGLWQDLGPLTEGAESNGENSAALPEAATTASPPEALPVEAQNWTRNDDGSVTLLATSSISPTPFERLPGCDSHDDASVASHANS